MQVLGRYTEKDRELDLDRYAAPRFYLGGHSSLGSCGENAYFALTHKEFTRSQKAKYGSILTISQMVALLKKTGFTVIPLSVCRVTNSRYLRNVVGDKHVVLNCQLMKRGEASWSICHDNKYYHGGDVEEPKILEFILRPIIASFVIWHSDWAYKPFLPIKVDATTRNGHK